MAPPRLRRETPIPVGTLSTVSTLPPARQARFWEREARAHSRAWNRVVSRHSSYESPRRSLAQLHRGSTSRPHRPAQGAPTATTGRIERTRPQPGLQLRGHIVNRGYGMEHRREWEPTYVSTPSRSPNPRPMVRSQTTSDRHMTPTQRIQSLITEAERHLANGRIDARLGATDRAREEFQQAHTVIQQALRIARARGSHIDGATLIDIGTTSQTIRAAEQSLEGRR